MSTLLDVRDISCSYTSEGTRETVVHNLSFQIQTGETICLLGPSGCGKTTTLRAIAGFENLDTGTISLAGSMLSKPGHTLSPEHRQLGMVFQDYALFPHLTVAGNIGFGLNGQKNRKERVEEMLDLTGLTALAERLPQELSGGQQQRVALARALAPAPRLILLDEPFSNLDTSLRQSLSYEVRTMLKKAGTSAIMVTHDQSEAFAFADTIGLFDTGRLAQWGTAQDLYQNPANPFVAQFIGEGSLLKGTRNAQGQIETAAGTFTPATAHDASEQTLLIRPEQLECDPTLPAVGKVMQSSFRGNNNLVRITLKSGEDLLIECSPSCGLETGTETGLRLKNPEAVNFMS